MRKGIPKGWNVYQLGKIVSFASGGTPSKSKSAYWDGDIPWISASSMHQQEINTSSLFITKAGLASGSRLAKENELLLLVRGSMLWKKIPICICKRDVAFNQDVKSIKTKNVVLPQFLLYWFLAHEKKLLYKVEGTGIGAGKLDSDMLKAIQLSLPPLLEQKAIANILSTWDKAIDILERLINLKLNYKHVQAKKLLDGSLRMEGYQHTRWVKKIMNQVFKRVTRKNTEHDKAILTISAELGLVPQNLFYKKRIASRDTSKYYLLKHGEFAYNKSYSTGHPMGAIRRLEYCKQGVVSSLYICFSLLNDNENSDFFKYYFEYGLMNNSLRVIAQEGARNHGLLNVPKEEFFSMPLYLPADIEEQKQIASIIGCYDKEIDLLKEMLQNYKTQKRGLMQQLLTGRCRVSKINLNEYKEQEL